MKKIKKRHVVFYLLKELYLKNRRETPSELPDLLEYIKNHTKIKRRISINVDKFCLLELAVYNKDENVYEIYFKSARHSFRPPLINRNTVAERENPKDINEGEIEKTHTVIKFNRSEVIMCLEKNKGGISINNFTDYLNHFHRKRLAEKNLEEEFNYISEIIPKDDFLKQLNKLKRVSVADIYLDKKILGSDFLNLSNRSQSIRQEVMLSIKSSRGESIKEFTVDAFNRFNIGKRQSIERISVHGKDDENGEVILNTDFIEKRNQIDVEYSETTGEINTKDILRKQLALLKIK
jgi:hypothetical protein